MTDPSPERDPKLPGGNSAGSAAACDSLRLEVRTQILLDQALGEVRPLAAYLERWSGSDALVAEIFCDCLTAASEPTTEPPIGNPPPESAPATARRIGPYRIERELGRGGQGNVFLAIDERLERRVALKLVPHGRFSAQPSPRFRREAELTAVLDHPSLCTVYDVGADPEVAWLAMRYVEGETLADRLAREGKLAVEESLRIAASAARALEEAHRRGVIHRDVKPSNLMLTKEGSVVVLDFGVATRVVADDRLTLQGEALGTPSYMAPEVVFSGAIAATPGSDVWSLGVVLHEMLTGRRPFEAATRDALYQSILREDPPPIRGGDSRSRDITTVLETALAKNDAARYASAALLADDLERVLRGHAILARRPGPFERVAQFYRRDPRFALALSGLAVLALAALVITTHLLERTRESLSRYTQLFNQTIARDLIAELDTLWPSEPATIPRLSTWLERSRDLEARRADYLAAKEGDAGDERDPWLHAQIDALLADLDRIAVVRPRIEARREFARTVEQRTLVDCVEGWRAAAKRVASDPRFDGFSLEPILGFVPLGPDPQSNLEEFALLESGRAPQRIETGRLEIDSDSSMVFVLLPGGRVTIGCEAPTAERPIGSPHIDAACGPYDGPLQSVRLDPFLLSKFEMTQGQWVALTGTNPSYYQYDSNVIVDPTRAPMHPVEQVTPRQFDRSLAFWRLELPSEAQWEFAARAGSSTVFSDGDDVATLRGRANIADVTAKRRVGYLDWAFSDEVDDGHVCHAPIGSFRPNRFGLYDVHGNVAEFCRDTFEDWREFTPRDGDGLCTGKYASRVYRGGSFGRGAASARIAAREGWNPDDASSSFGARPVRRIVIGATDTGSR